MVPRLLVTALGVTRYADALALMRAAAAARVAGTLDEDLLLLVEHPPVLTLGRRAADNRLLASPALLAARGVELHEVERGGGSTFHGPGQLVGYPIVDLKRHRRDLHWYLRQIEQALIDAVAGFGSRQGATRRSPVSGPTPTRPAVRSGRPTFRASSPRSVSTPATGSRRTGSR